MVRLKLDLSGSDAVLLSNMYRYHTGLSALSLYRDHPDLLPKLDLVKGTIDVYQHGYEGSKTGNHAQFAIRNKARKEAVALFRTILFYLQAVATEDDIPDLIQAGFSVRRFGGRRKQVVAPAT